MKISAFADEMSDDLGEQISFLKAHAIDCIELRGVWSKNVLEKFAAARGALQRILAKIK
jgi:hypothetical protein